MKKSKSEDNSRTSKINLLSESENDENYAYDNSSQVAEIEIHSNQPTKELDYSDNSLAHKPQIEKHRERELNSPRSSKSAKNDEDSNASSQFKIISEKPSRITRTKTFIKKAEIPTTHKRYKTHQSTKENKENTSEAENKNENELKAEDAILINPNSYEILTIEIIKTDELLIDSFVLKTFVQVHLIDSETNEYIKKTNTHNISSRNNSVDYIDKIVSKISNTINCSKFQLIWNDKVVISEVTYEYIQTHRTLIMFFEILEHQETNESKTDKIIAWGFLKPQNNFERSLRLQLFYPQNIHNRDLKSKAHFWWKKKRMRKYPASLWIKLCKESRNIKTQKSPPHLQIKSNTNASKKAEEMDITDELPKSIPIPPKLDYFNSKPKHKVLEIPTGDYGCYTLQFSHNESYLAFVTNDDNDTYNIVVYSFQNETEYCRLGDHQGFIYDLAWSLDDRLLLSASADNTVIIWDITMQKLEHILPHPSYVYCCLFYDGIDSCVVTGSFDKHIRIWSLASYRVLEEIKEHKGYVTSICFDKGNKNMYSADSKGQILKWTRDNNTWKLKQSILNLELRDVIINQIIIHHKDRRLIVNCRDGHIRLIDIKTEFILASFTKDAIEKNNLKCVLTSCNTYLISGTESGEVYVWQAHNGKVENVFMPYNKQVAIHCCKFQPKYGLFAFCHFGSKLPIIIYGSKSCMAETSVSHLQRRLINTSNNDTLAQIKNGSNFRTILNKFDNIVKLHHS